MYWSVGDNWGLRLWGFLVFIRISILFKTSIINGKRGRDNMTLMLVTQEEDVKFDVKFSSFKI